MNICFENRSNYTITYDPAVPALGTAAEELNIALEKSCGFTLSENDEKAIHAIKFCVGGGLSSEEFTIDVKGEDAVITGGTPRSAIYGAYELLERFLGVRYFNTECMRAPKHEGLFVPDVSIRLKPYFTQRNFLQWQTIKDARTASRMRFVDAEIFPNGEKFGFKKLWCDKISSSHNSLSYVPLEKYMKTHPEFFCKNSASYELCYSNGITDDGEFDKNMGESVAEAVCNSLIGYIKQCPESEYFMFGKQDDFNALCHCPLCEERRKKFGGEAGVMTVFLNAVIKETLTRLAAEGISSDFKMVTFAYGRTLNPPVTEDFKPVHEKVVPCERLYIRYAPLSADFTYSLVDERQLPEIRRQVFGWTAITHNIMVWDYNCNYTEYNWYFPNLKYFKDNILLYKRTKMAYVMNQGAHNIEREWQGELKSYIASKLYWDTSLEVKDLLSEYVEGVYGPAAKEVVKFMDMMEKFFAEAEEKGLKVSVIGAGGAFFNPSEYPLSFLLSCLETLDMGLKKIKESNLDKEEKAAYVKRLERVMLTPIRMIAKNEYFYFPDGNGSYNEKFYAIAEKHGLSKFGESVNLFTELVEDGKSEYKIVLGQNPTEKEKRAALLLQKRIRDTLGANLDIVKDDKVFPAFLEKAICVGNNAMFPEFFKDLKNADGFEYFTELCGNCAFVSGVDLKKAAEAFLSSLIIKGNSAKMPYIKKRKAL